MKRLLRILAVLLIAGNALAVSSNKMAVACWVIVHKSGTVEQAKQVCRCISAGQVDINDEDGYPAAFGTNYPSRATIELLKTVPNVGTGQNLTEWYAEFRKDCIVADLTEKEKAMMRTCRDMLNDALTALGQPTFTNQDWLECYADHLNGN